MGYPPLADLLRRASYRLLPGRCLICGAASGQALDLCSGCERELPQNRSCCPVCALPIGADIEASALCGQCQSNPPPYHYCLAPLRYEFPVNLLINRFKHHGKFSAGALLAECLLRKLYRQPELPDLLIPVPLHWRRRWQRGFNQSAWLADYLGRRLDIPVCHKVLRRTRYTPQQQGQSRSQRLRNLKGAFHLREKLTGKAIGLVDDVVTTGSTINELGRVLRAGGADRVDVWCLARTPLEK